MRDLAKQHPLLVAIVCVVVLIASLSFLFFGGEGSSTADELKDYWYDVVTQEIFVGPAAQIPPIQNDAGHEAVRAFFFTCGECTARTVEEGGQRFLGYYEKFSPDRKSRMEKAVREGMPMMIGRIPGHFFSADGTTWHDADSEQGIQIRDGARRRCAEIGGTSRNCRP